MKKIFLLAAIVALAMMGSAQALEINYTVGGTGPMQFPGSLITGIDPPADAPHVLDGQGYPGDTIEFSGYSGTINIDPGSSAVAQVNTLHWTVDWTYQGTNETAADDWTGDWPEMFHDVVAARSISFGGGGGGAISQQGLLENGWEDDFLQFYAGPTSSFVVDGYWVYVTPLALAPVGTTGDTWNQNGGPWIQADRNVMALFEVGDLAPVPEPATMGLMGLGLAGLMVTRIRKRLSA